MTKYRKLAAVLFAGSLVVAACGDDDDSTTATTASAATEAPATEAPSTEAPSTEAPATEAPSTEAPGTEAPGTTEAASSSDSGMAAAQANVDKYSTPDGTIGVTIPLSGVAEKHTIAWLECDVPTCAAYITPGFKAATEAIGWDLKIIPMKSTDPGPAFQQAIDQGVDYIASM